MNYSELVEALKDMRYTEKLVLLANILAIETENNMMSIVALDVHTKDHIYTVQVSRKVVE